MVTRSQAIMTHRVLVSSGDYYAARLVLSLLTRGRVLLGIGDDAWGAQVALEAAGGSGRTVSGGYMTFRLSI